MRDKLLDLVTIGLDAADGVRSLELGCDFVEDGACTTVGHIVRTGGRLTGVRQTTWRSSVHRFPYCFYG